MELFGEIIPLKLNDIKNMQIKSLNLNEFIKIDDTLSLNHYTCTFIKNYLNNQLNVSNFIKNIDIHFTNDNFDYDFSKLKITAASDTNEDFTWDTLIQWFPATETDEF